MALRGTSSQKTKSFNNPIVLLIDLDHTLQGDIRPQIMEYELVKEINRSITNGTKIRYNVPRLYSDFRNGLLRPGVSSLMNIKKRHPNIEMFVYTASEHEWANYIVPKLEQVAFDGKFFNRPILTRKHVGKDGVKSIRGVQPIVERTLIRKYGDGLKQIQYPIYLIDNNEVLAPVERKHLVKCPTYNFIYMIDPFRTIPDDIVHNHNSFTAIANYFGVPAQLRSNHYSSMEYIYIKINNDLLSKEKSRQLIDVDDNNKIYAKDMYWKRVAAVFSKSNLEHVNEIARVFNLIKHLHA